MLPKKLGVQNLTQTLNPYPYHHQPTSTALLKCLEDNEVSAPTAMVTAATPETSTTDLEQKKVTDRESTEKYLQIHFCAGSKSRHWNQRFEGNCPDLTMDEPFHTLPVEPWRVTQLCNPAARVPAFQGTRVRLSCELMADAEDEILSLLLEPGRP